MTAIPENDTSQLPEYVVENPGREWMLSAPCRGLDMVPEMEHGLRMKAQTRLQRRVCRESCLVRAQCAAYALSHKEHPYGVWAGVACTGYGNPAQLQALLEEADRGGLVTWLESDPHFPLTLVMDSEDLELQSPCPDPHPAGS